MAVDPIKARLAELSFKKASGGLTPEEEQEMDSLRRQLQMAKSETRSGAFF